MYGVLFVFAGVAVTQAIEAIKRRKPYSIFGAFARR
jgi:hypothetical protein